MRPRHRLLVGLSAVGLLGVGAALALGAGYSHDEVAIPDDGPWVIGLEDPRGRWAECFDDDVVAQSLATADMPTSHASATLHPTATKADVRRITGCLDDFLTGGAMTVTTLHR